MIYLDNNATTRLAPEVLEIMTRYYMQDYANPNSIHSMGLTANMAMEEAREKIASLLGANPRKYSLPPALPNRSTGRCEPLPVSGGIGKR